MEREQWIQNVINSTNGMTAVTPDDALFSEIQHKIKLQESVSPKTVWMVAASIAALLLLNVALLGAKSHEKQNATTIYLENTLNKSNQLY